MGKNSFKLKEELKIKSISVSEETPISSTEKSDANEFVVTAKGGIFLRKTPPSNTNAISGAGAAIGCISYEDIFVETERSNNWSYGKCKDKFGWVCNIYLAKK